jgi:hypothetical protein
MNRPAPVLARRRRWPLFVPFAVVALAAVAWSGLWLYASSRAETEIAAWREREAKAGRAQDCAAQSIGGYPFRIEARCDSATFTLAGTPTLHFKLPSALAVAQLYQPTFAIGEFTGPLEIAEPGGGPSYVADWRLAQASVRVSPPRIERASLALDALSVRAPAIAGNEPVFRAARLELHGREAEGSTPANPVIDTVLRVTAAVADKLHPLAAKPIDGEITARVRGINDISPKPWPVRFKEWQAHDGQLEIVKARIQQEDVMAVGAGTLRLTARGGLDGNLQVTVVGIEKVLKMFDIERVMSEGQIGATIDALDRLIPGLGGIARQNTPGIAAALGQRTVLDGKPAASFPLRFADGAILFGPFQVGQIAPLF